MQTQYYPVPTQPFHHQDVYHTQAAYMGQAASSTCLSAGGLDLSSFSRGSSLLYPHQEYRHLPDRGGDPSSLCSSALCTTSLCATGMGITGSSVSTSDFFQPEGIADFSPQQRWQWAPAPESLHGLPLPLVPHLPRVPSVHLPQQPFPTIKSSSLDYLDESSLVLSPTAQRPTPASMAVLLNPNSCTKGNSPQAPYQPLPATQPQLIPAATRPVPPLQVVPATPAAVATHTIDSLSREKKHGCTMCHKRFDRPSTLRKHLLVHTGEKAFVCDTCGRRFGVASNLNRHVKKCILKPVNTVNAAGKQTGVDASSDTCGRDPSPSTSNASSSSSSDHVSSPVRQSSQGPPSPPRQSRATHTAKRRRRAPSPSRWVPISLLNFNLSPPESKKSTPVPLPPVRRNLPREERDSWDENVSVTPYHPRGWKDVLPGPGLGLTLALADRDMGSLNFSGSGSFMLGRVLVF